MWDKIKRFLFASVYEVITWVWIGFSIGAYFYNAGNKNAVGVRWSVFSLGTSVVCMLLFIGKRIFWDAESDKLERPRPELYSSGAMMGPLVAGQPETVLVGFKNRGSATARNICVGGGNHVFTKADFAGPLVYKHVPVEVRHDLGPGAEEKVSYPNRRNPSPRSRSINLTAVKFCSFTSRKVNTKMTGETLTRLTTATCTTRSLPPS